jgi:hypothetical protein
MKVCRNPRAVLVALSIAGLVGGSAAYADTITAVSVSNATTGSNPSSGDVSVSASVGNGGFTGVQPPQTASCADPNGCAWGQVLVSPTPTVSTEVMGTASTSGTFLPEGSAGLTYDFTVNGPGSTAVVDIFSVSLSTLVSPEGCTSDCYYDANTLGFVTPAVSGNTQYFGFSEACSEEFTFECNSNFSSDTASEVEATVSTSAGNELNLAANVNVSNGSNVEAFAQMYVWIAIDPSTPDASAYTLSFSDNVGNSSPVTPEPPTGALLTTAAAALCFRRMVSRIRRAPAA